MSWYFMLRYGLVSLLLIGWIFYQLAYKRKPWAELKNDAYAASFFLAVWIALAYYFTH